MAIGSVNKLLTMVCAHSFAGEPGQEKNLRIRFVNVQQITGARKFRVPVVVTLNRFKIEDQVTTELVWPLVPRQSRSTRMFRSLKNVLPACVQENALTSVVAFYEEWETQLMKWVWCQTTRSEGLILASLLGGPGSTTSVCRKLWTKCSFDTVSYTWWTLPLWNSCSRAAEDSFRIFRRRTFVHKKSC